MKNLIYLYLLLLFSCSKNADLTKVPDDFVNERPNVVVEEKTLRLQWSEATLDFPVIGVGSTTERILILTNKGSGKTAPVQLNFANLNSPFAIKNGDNQCSGKELEPQESCAVTIQFTPTTNSLVNNVLTATDLLTSSSIVVSGSGSGGVSVEPLPANLIWFLSDYNFGSLATASQQYFDFILVNIGGQNSEPINISLENDPSEFLMTSGFNFCENQVLTSGSSCKVRITYSPQDVGIDNNKLKAQSGTQEIYIDLIGQGVVIPSQLTFEIVSYDFNQVFVGQEKNYDVMLKNNSVINSSVVSLNWSDSNVFSIVSGFDNCSGSIINGGGQCSIKIRFSPTLAGQDLSNVLTASDGFSTSSITFSGDGIDPNSQNPIAFNQNFSLVEDSVFNSFLLATDPNARSLTYSIVNNPTKGTVVLMNSSTGQFRYTPNPNQNGSDSFTFRVTNSAGQQSLVVSANLNIVAVNDNPMAVTDSATVVEGGQVDISVLLNDIDVDGDILSVVSVTQPSKGMVSINANGTIRYVSGENSSGSDSFTYVVSDGNGGSYSAIVQINIIPVNDSPVSQNKSFNINEDSILNNFLTGIDVDSASLTYSIVSPPSFGTVVITNSLNGAFRYIPQANYNGSDSFTFKVNDGEYDSNISTVTINISPVNDTPIAQNGVANIMEDIPKLIALVASDVDGDALTYEITNSPLKGVLTGSAPNLTYTPDANFNGFDNLSFRVFDGQGWSDVATINITVWPDNDNPIALDSNMNVQEDSVNNLSSLQANDIDGDTLNFEIVAGPTKGNVVLLNPILGTFTYTPNGNQNGSDSFTFKVNDGKGESNVATVNINIESVFDNPMAYNSNIQAILNTEYTGSFVYQHIENNSLNFVIVTPASNGLVTILNAETGSFSYNPNQDYLGSDSFTYRIETGLGNSEVKTVSIEVVSNNIAPTAMSGNIALNEDTIYSGNLTASDADNNLLIYSIVSNPSKGIITLNPNTGAYTYTPNGNQNGSDSFSFRVYDGFDYSNTASISVDISAVNDAPLAHAKVIATTEENPVSINLSGFDVESSPLNYILVINPVNGVLTGTAPNLVYTPNTNFSGTDSFTYKVNDGQLDSSTVTVSISVASINDTPVAQALSFNTNEDTVYNGNLIATDTDNDNLTYILTVQPTKGSIVLNPVTGSFEYTPNSNFHGSDSFSFKVNDGQVDSNVALVAVTVNSVNDIPVANEGSFEVNEDTLYTGSVSALDQDGESLTYSIVNNTTHGVLTFNSNGTFSYKPNQDYSGSDSFSFKVNDGQVDSNVAIMSIQVLSHNNLPIAQNSNISTNEDTIYNGTLIASDVDNDSLTFSVISNPSKGIVSIINSNTGLFSYLPNQDQNGSDSFTFRVSDGRGNSNLATVAVNINPINDAPVALEDSFSFNRNTAGNIYLVAYDIEGDNVSYQVMTQPTKGVISGTAPNLIYTPNNNETGSDTMTFKVNDGLLDSNIATLTLTILNTNRLPVANNSSFSTLEDTSFSGNVSATDEDGDPLTYSVVNNPTKGTLVLNTNGSYSYTPFLNQNGSDSFTFIASDGQGVSNIATVLIGITPVNDAPVANTQVFETKENTAKNLLLTGSDVEGSSLSYQVLSQPSKGVLSGTAPNLIYTPNQWEIGSDSFTFKVNDGQLDSTVATVNINIKDLGKWFNTSWSHRRRLHINNRNFGALSNFPVMVKLDPTRIDYSKTKTGGADLRFADINGNLLSYEIERWNPAGISVLWVKIPNITANSLDNSFFMYYGNSAASAAQNKNQVWDSNFIAVYHKEETTGLPQDSTIGANHITSSNGTIEMNVSGKIAGAENFVSTNASYSAGTNSSFNLTGSGAFTLEAWVYPTATGSDRFILGVQSGGGSSPHEYSMLVNNGKLKMTVRGSSIEFTNDLPLNTWSYVSATYDISNSTCQLFASSADNFISSTSCMTAMSGGGTFRIGNRNAQDQAFPGALDEVRVSNIARSLDWRKAQYKSMSDGYIFFGSEQNHDNALLKSMLSTIELNVNDGGVSSSGIFSSDGQSLNSISMGQSGNNNSWGYYRFKMNKSIPSTANVVNSRIKLFGVGIGADWNSSNRYLGIIGERSADAPVVSSNNSFPGSGRTPSSATSSWGSPGLNWVVNDWNTSPDVKNISQEIISTYNGMPINTHMQFWVSRGYVFSSSNINQTVRSEDFSTNMNNSAMFLIEWSE